MTELFKRLLEQRGLGVDFLRPQYQPEYWRGQLPDIKQAVARIKQAVEQGEKVLIYGDYDVDGVTASTILHDALQLAGVEEIEIMLPDRFKEGYGMHLSCVERAQELKTSLVITVDCGANNEEVIAALAEAGIDVIVTDHHELAGAVPTAVAVVDAKRPDCSCADELKELCGAGVAFMLADELVAAGLIPAGQEKWLLDLVMIGTICDNMVLRGLNRELCYYGFKVLEKTRRIGLKELMRVAGVKTLNTDAIGFQLGPRLNAGGRMESAEIALQLLMTQSRAEALKLSNKLEELNGERKRVQGTAIAEVAKAGVTDEPVLVAVGEGWHEGVLGIIAGRLVEQYHRPCFALAEVEDGVLKGSGRSFGDFNLAEALSECQKWLETGGGHAGACGVKLLMVNLPKFRQEINNYYKSLELKDQEKFLEKQEDLTVEQLEELSVELVDELKQLEPYGIGNEEPVWLLSNVLVQEARRMGSEEQHLRLTVRDNRGKLLKLVAFYAPKEWMQLSGGEHINAWINLTGNEWNGQRSAEGRIVRLTLV